MSARILVVDDEEPFTRMLKLVFEAEDYLVVTASSAAGGVRAIAADSFDIVLTDMRMETDTAGYDVVRAARVLPRPPAVVIFTAFPLAGEWVAAGAVTAISKPSQIDSLLRLVRDLLQGRTDHTLHAP